MSPYSELVVWWLGCLRGPPFRRELGFKSTQDSKVTSSDVRRYHIKKQDPNIKEGDTQVRGSKIQATPCFKQEPPSSPPKEKYKKRKRTKSQRLVPPNRLRGVSACRLPWSRHPGSPVWSVAASSAHLAIRPDTTAPSLQTAARHIQYMHIYIYILGCPFSDPPLQATKF